ncbi:helix-turn-helix domain-containing protein [Zoogloea sp.]|uniref:helix-turn-helix domain-containing protein n=1 Tax=Zoogloea sp. TaxID=49181 RepID=UPI003FCE3047
MWEDSIVCQRRNSSYRRRNGLDAAAAFGKVLRRLRRQRGLTQEQLGLESDLRRTYVSLLELGRQQPSLTTILKLATALGQPPGALVDLAADELLRGYPKPPQS